MGSIQLLALQNNFIVPRKHNSSPPASSFLSVATSVGIYDDRENVMWILIHIKNGKDSLMWEMDILKPVNPPLNPPANTP